MSKKLITAGVVAAVLASSVVATTSSAQAGGYWGGPWHHHHRHYGWGGPVALGLGALAVGGAIAAASDCYYVRQPVVDEWGNVVGYRRVPSC
jgi:hypothetical protein